MNLMCSERIHDFSHRRYDIRRDIRVLNRQDFVSDEDKADLGLWIVREDIGFDPIFSYGLVRAERCDLVVRYGYGDVEIGLREECETLWIGVVELDMTSFDGFDEIDGLVRRWEVVSLSTIVDTNFAGQV